MSEFLKFLLIALAALSVITLVYVAFKYGKKKQPKDIDDIIEDILAEEEAQEAVEEVAQPVVDEKEVIPEEIIIISSEKTQDVVKEESAVTELEDDSDDREIIKRVPFAEKLLGLDVKTQGYYNTLVNEFISYRKINKRISTPCLSLRFGRALVAKITARGKTMKLHLNLDVNKFESNIYFQKDLSDVKAYAEVPFTVKVKSDRAVRNAIKLIEALAQTHGIEKKTRFEPVDAVAELKASLK